MKEKIFIRKQKIDTFKLTIDQFAESIGGVDNINSIFHCATRLRFTLKNDDLVDKDKLKNIDKSKGFSKDGNQWQIIFGAGIVNKVYEKYIEIFDTKASKTNFENNEKKKFKWNYNFSTKSNILLALRHGIRSFANIFIPLIPLFILGGLSLAFNNIITSSSKVGDVWTNDAARIFSFMFDLIGGAILGSLPVFIGYTSAKQWGGNKWLGAGMGLILISPALINGWSLQNAELRYYNLFDPNIVWNSNGDLLPGITSSSGGATYIPTLWHSGIFALGIPVFDAPLLGYQAQVVPTLLVILVMIQIEKLIKKISHESFAIISVPLFTGVLTTVLAFVVIGPIGRLVGAALATFLQWIFIYTNFPGFGLGGALIGSVYAPIVVTGLHQGFLPIEATLVATEGVTWITPIATVANIAQGIACLTSVIFFRQQKTKGLAVTGGISANLGITEPAIFGVNINIKHIFLAGCIGGAVGGYWVGMTQTVANTFGSASWIGLIQFNWTLDSTNIVNWYNNVANATPWGHQMNIGLSPGINMIIALLITTVSTAIVTILLSLGKKSAKNFKEVNNDLPQAKLINLLQNKIKNLDEGILNIFLKINWFKNYYDKKNTTIIYSPINGKIINKKDIDDLTFKNDLLGQSIAISPSNNEYNLYSPIKGKVTSIFDTGHAITITNKIENSILLHVGLDTAQINLNAPNLQKLKFFKFKKLIGSNVNVYRDKKHLNSKEIVDVDSIKLKENGAKSNDLFIVLLNESIKKNQKIEIIKSSGIVKIGDPIAKIFGVN